MQLRFLAAAGPPEALEHLSRMDPYLLRDMGLEIDDVEEALRAGPHSVLLEPMHR